MTDFTIIEIRSITDYGTIVTLEGVDEDGRPRFIHMDHSPARHFFESEPNLSPPFTIEWNGEAFTLLSTEDSE